MKICLVTGGSRGIGAATVEKFAEEGYTVIANYNKSGLQAESLRQNLVAKGYDVHIYRADVSKTEEVFGMFEWVTKYFKKLDVLVNNAGVSCNLQIQDVTEADFDRVFATNVKSAYFCCKNALPLFIKANGGSIVNVSSIWGVEGASCESVYSMSKFALVGMTKSLAAELNDLKINVNCVCPPIVQTDMCAHLSDEEKAAFCSEHNVKLYTPQKVAEDIYLSATCGQTGKIAVEK